MILEPKEGEPQHALEARKKWQDRFARLTDDTSEARAKAEAGCAKAVLRCFSRFMASEISILESLSRKPLDYKRAFSCVNKTMRMMFLHAVQSLLWNQVTSFRIEKLGREIVAGDLVLDGSNDVGSKNNQSVRTVTEEDVAAGKYKLDDVVLPLLGTKSKRPDNESGKLFDKLLEENKLTMELFKKIQDRDISCPGDYRKLICRPSDVDFTIAEYNDPYQPLLQTDLMKLNGVKVLEEEDNVNDENTLLGMVVGFTLPSSAYATIALRELMKKPTSSEYQSGLGLGGSANDDGHGSAE
jgi:tRNA pseudouridine13 synthase